MKIVEISMDEVGVPNTATNAVIDALVTNQSSPPGFYRQDAA
jgi:hypothetical protein